MAKRLAFTILVTVLGTSALLPACADEEDRIEDTAGGEAGNDAGANPGGSSSGGTSAGEGGSLTAGGEMQGGQSQGGAGAAGDAGMAGEGGDTTPGGASGGGGGATDGGASGMGGAANPPVVYACGNTTIARRLCSAYAAAECESLPACTGDPMPDPCCTDCPAPSCPDCVSQADVERQTFTECAACLAEYDRNLLCGIEPFEAGNVSEGIACFDMFGAYQVEACDALLFSAQNCVDYIFTNPCPATWPLE